MKKDCQVCEADLAIALVCLCSKGCSYFSSVRAAKIMNCFLSTTIIHQRHQLGLVATQYRRAKMLFKNKRLYWFDRLKKNGKQRLHPCSPQPVNHPLPFKIIYTNTVLLFFVAEALCVFKTSTILVYIILNGKAV